MPTQLLLDGDDLAALLQRVRDELGPEAVVVKADRVRTGGVGGFFAKEHFEVTVEVPDVPPTRRAPHPPQDHASGGIQALLAAADASDDDERPARPAAATPVSTESSTFAALLASIDGGMSGTQSPGLPAPRESRDSRPVPPATTAEAPDAVAGPPVARLVDRSVAVTAAGFGPLHPVLDAGAPAQVVPADTADAVPGTPSAAAAPSTVTPGRSGVHPATFARLPAGTPTTRDAAAVRTARLTEDAALREGSGADVSPAPAAAPPPAPAVPQAGGRPSTPDPVVDRGAARQALAGVGIPAALLVDAAGDVLAALPAVLGRIPRPPAVLGAPGSLVVVVGEGAGVVVAAREMALRAGLDPQDVALAGDLRPTDATDREVLTAATAPRQRSRTSTLGAVTLVAVAVGPDRDDRRAAATLLDALDPDQCWAVVDARRKAADLRGWMAEVAGARRFAGVAGTRAGETREPGTLLDLGVPVGSLDGQPATTVVWAAVLAEQLEPGARPA